MTFTDSCKILTFSMSQLLQDLVGILEDAAAGGAALEEAFDITLRHVLAEGYDKNDFFYLLKKNWKFVMTFEKIDSLAYLEAQSSPPPMEHFASLLSGRAILSEVDYDLFLNTWKRLRIENMFQLFRLYLALFVTNLTCVLDFYFQKMFKQTRLYASHFFTISSLALAAALLNSSDSEKPERTSLAIPLLDEDTYHLFSEALIGGYSSTNAKLANWNPCQTGIEEETTGGWFLDINSLYPAILTSDLPFSEYTHFLDSDRNNFYFRLVKKKLQDSDVNFFWSLYHKKNLKFLFKVKLKIQTGHCRKTTPLTWLDLSAFPIREKVNPRPLSQPQRDVAQLLGRSVGSKERMMPRLDKRAAIFS